MGEEDIVEVSRWKFPEIAMWCFSLIGFVAAGYQGCRGAPSSSTVQPVVLYTPVPMAGQFTHMVIPFWLRGSVWGLDSPSGGFGPFFSGRRTAESGSS